MRAGDSTPGGGTARADAGSLYREEWALQIAWSDVGNDIRKRQVP